MNASTDSELDTARQRVTELRSELGKVILGQDAVLDQMIITLLCGGHALLEGVPGTGKTLAVRTLARALACDFKRIQFTPDLMPSDIVGTSVYNLSTHQFTLHKGPAFTDLLLADEINRASAKTQSALLEGMSEAHATIEGTRHQLSPIFTVFATQNPVEFEGTYPLPEAQQDRFLLKIKIDYPPADSELALLDAVDKGKPPDQVRSADVKQVMSPQDLLAVRGALVKVRVEPGVLRYVLNLVRATRGHDAVLVGAGPRGSIFLLIAAKARALLQSRDYVTPDDVVAMANGVLGHRMTLAADAEVSGTTTEEVIRSVLDTVEVPR